MTPSMRNPRLVARRLGDELRSLAAWWVRELHESWLEMMEWLAPNRARRFVIEIENEQGTVRQVGAAATVPTLQFSLDEAGKPPPLEQFWTDEVPKSARALVVLPESSVLLCPLHLPPVHDRDVDSVIDLQLERELPLPREQLYIDWETQEKQADRSRSVTVAIARRRDVDKLRDAIHSWGWSTLAVGLKGGRDLPRFNFSPIGARGLDFSLRRGDWLLISSAAVLCLSYCLITVGQWWFERSTLAPALNHARTAVAGIHRRQAELQAVGEPIVALRNVMQSKSASDALMALSSSVPSDTWVYQAEIRAPVAADTLIKLEAYTPAATKFVSELQQSNQLKQVQLVETASYGVGVASDRVELTARLRDAPR